MNEQSYKDALQEMQKNRRLTLTEINVKELINDKQLMMYYCIQVLKVKPEKRLPQEILLLKTMAENIAFFNNLTQTDEAGNIIDKCVSVLKHQSLSENEVLFRIGDQGSLFYIILEGQVGINIRLPSPTEPYIFELKEINVLKAGASFGELALLNDNVQRTATIIAKTPCEMATMEKKDFKNILGKVQEFKVQKKISFLCQFPFFQAWSFREVKTISYHFEEISFTTSSKVYSKGDQSNYIYVVREGCFEMNIQLDIKDTSKYYPENSAMNQRPIKQFQQMYSICLLSQGEFFGEESFLVKEGKFQLKLFKRNQIKELTQRQNQVQSKEKMETIQDTNQPQNEEQITDKTIQEPIKEQQWSLRCSDIQCKSRNGLLYRISREDIQRRFWEYKTQKIFLNLLSLLHEYRQARIQYFRDQADLKNKEQQQTVQIQHFLKKDRVQNEVTISDRKTIEPKIISSRRNIKEPNAKNQIFLKNMQQFLSSGTLYEFQNKNQLENQSIAEQRVLEEYQNIRATEKLALKKFANLYKQRNCSYSQVKNFFDQKTLIEQNILDKRTYTKLLFRFNQKSKFRNKSQNCTIQAFTPQVSQINSQYKHLGNYHTLIQRKSSSKASNGQQRSYLKPYSYCLDQRDFLRLPQNIDYISPSKYQSLVADYQTQNNSFISEARPRSLYSQQEQYGQHTTISTTVQSNLKLSRGRTQSLQKPSSIKKYSSRPTMQQQSEMLQCISLSREKVLTPELSVNNNRMLIDYPLFDSIRSQRKTKTKSSSEWEHPLRKVFKSKKRLNDLLEKNV